ncbi:DoxX family protein [Streptomyces sp. VRA16 Mangrove soil]|uniref:DoxX family protein n=1 Tax=Streptomyces sp. VRA16 Mangrove soil TaxID=2817434 RepID=UPI001A9EA6C6|nr:DoxX family protein [Streptomyces sp. VRA16 Mangrove soil]MBO1330438.1 DoxX family protein [Streptomyces sp. VRA16 Mangrove soil]
MPGFRSDTLRRAVALAPAHRFQSAAPSIVRVAAGAVTAVHGIDKLVDGPAGFGVFLSSLSVPAPTATGWAVAIGETLGGLLLVLGLLSRLTALLLTAHLCVAIALVNADTGFLTPQQGPAGGAGAEFPLMMVAAFLVVLLAGPGPLALDRPFGIELPPPAGHKAAVATRPCAVRASVVSGVIGGVIGAAMSALANYLVVGVPSTAGANAANHAVSGLISGFFAGFFGLLMHQRKHGPATGPAAAGAPPVPATAPTAEF